MHCRRLASSGRNNVVNEFVAACTVQVYMYLVQFLIFAENECTSIVCTCNVGTHDTFHLRKAPNTKSASSIQNNKCVLCVFQFKTNSLSEFSPYCTYTLYSLLDIWGEVNFNPECVNNWIWVHSTRKSTVFNNFWSYAQLLYAIMHMHFH